MTIDEAIKHAEEAAEKKERDLKFYERVNEDRPIFREEENECKECAEEHRQLAEWLKELKQLREQTRWIPVKFGPLTDEEQDEYPDYCYMADCPMPDDGEEILVSTKYGRVEKDECGFDDGFYLDSGYDWQTDIKAWMPLPEPYAESED